MTQTEQEKTAVQILSSRVHALEHHLNNCREASSRLSGMLIDYMNKESRNPYIRVPREIRKRKGNTPSKVQARYDIWRILSENGMSDFDIAKECGANRNAINYARQNKWKAKPAKHEYTNLD